MKSLPLPTLLGVLLLGIGSYALANPFTIDRKRRPIRMTAEDVTIVVGPKQSTVKGTYRFQQLSDDWPAEKDEHVLIYVPVFLFQNAKSDIPDPVVKVGKVAIKSREWDDLTLSDDPAGGLQDPSREFYLKAYQYPVPLGLVKRTFTISVEYIQPSFRGHIAGYLPIKPPAKNSAGRITFTPRPGYALKPFHARNFWNPSFPKLAFTPQDRELLRVKCVKAHR